MRRPGNELQSVQVIAMAKHEAPIELAAPAPAPPAPVVSAASLPAAPASNELAMNEPKPEAAPRAEAMSESAPRTLRRLAAAPGARAMSMQAGEEPGNSGAGAQRFGSAEVASGAAGAVTASDAVAAAQSTLVTIAPPDRSVTWFVGKNGMVRRRDADGVTHIQRSGVSTDLTAGAAPSAAVCWIVGRSGTIIRTTDGEHWTLVSAPTVDNLIAVSARGANDATVTTAGGRSFATSDGGASWHPQ